MLFASYSRYTCNVGLQERAGLVRGRAGWYDLQKKGMQHTDLQVHKQNKTIAAWCSLEHYLVLTNSLLPTYEGH